MDKYINTNKIYIGKIYETYKITDKNIEGYKKLGPFKIQNISCVSHSRLLKVSLLYKDSNNAFIDLLSEEKYDLDKDCVLGKPFISSKFPLVAFNTIFTDNNKVWISRKKLLEQTVGIIRDINYDIILENVSEDKILKRILINGGKK